MPANSLSPLASQLKPQDPNASAQPIVNAAAQSGLPNSPGAVANNARVAGIQATNVANAHAAAASANANAAQANNSTAVAAHQASQQGFQAPPANPVLNTQYGQFPNGNTDTNVTNGGNISQNIGPDGSVQAGTAYGAAGLGGSFAGTGNNGQSELFGNLSTQEALAKQQGDFGFGTNNTATANQAIGQAQDTGQFYAGQFNNVAGGAAANSSAAANRGTAQFNGDMSGFAGSSAQAGQDRGLQTGSFNALNQFANGAQNAGSVAGANLGAAAGQAGALAQFGQSAQAPMNAQGQLNAAGQSAAGLQALGNTNATGAASGNFAAGAQNAGSLTNFGNSAITNAGAGNLAAVGQSSQGLQNFAGSGITNAGAGQIAQAGQAGAGLGKFAAAPIQTAAGQQVAQANNSYDQLQQFANQGIGPSAAQQQLLQSTDANTNNALAMARSGSGLGGNAAALKQALNANAQTQQTANSQMAELRANENTAYQGQRLSALGTGGTLANQMGSTLASENTARMGQQEAALQGQGDIANTSAGLNINNQLTNQAQRNDALLNAGNLQNTAASTNVQNQLTNQAQRNEALTSAAGIQNAQGNALIGEEGQNQQAKISALNAAAGAQNASAGITNQAQMSSEANRLAAMQSSGALSNTSAGLQINENQANQANALNALTNAGTVGTAARNSDVALGQLGLSGAQYQTQTALAGTGLNDQTALAWQNQNTAATQNAMAAEQNAQANAFNINNASLGGRQAQWSAANAEHATDAGIASAQSIANTQLEATGLGGLAGAAGLIGAAAFNPATVSSDATEKDIALPLGAMPAVQPLAPTRLQPAPAVNNAPSLDKIGEAKASAEGTTVGGTAGSIAGGAAGSAVAGPVGGLAGSILGSVAGKIVGGGLGRLIHSDVRSKTNIVPLSESPGAAKDSYQQLQALAAKYGAGGVATTGNQVTKYASGKPSANSDLASLTAPGMRGVGPTGNPGDAILAQSARNAPPSVYSYKDPSSPGAAPGLHTGPMAQDLAANPVTAGAVGKDPSSGKLFVDGGRLALANTAQNHSQQNQIDAVDGKINDLKKLLGKSSGKTPYPTPQAPPDDDPYGLQYNPGPAYYAGAGR